MQPAANNNLVLTDSSSFKWFADLQKATSYGAFYQQVSSELVKGVCTKHLFRELSDRLVGLAEYAHTFRQMDTLEQVSQILLSLPLANQYQSIGRYYQALCVHRFGRGDVVRAQHLLERVAGEAPLWYRLRAIQSLAGNSYHKGGYETALSLYREAGCFASRNRLYDPYATVGTQKMVAVINSEEGNHRDALALLENLLPLAHHMRSLQPHVYHDYLNSLAVELCEVGRLEEAKNVSQIVLASPFANAYPEWRETRDEIELRGWRAPRSVVAFSQTTAEAALSQSTADAALSQAAADPAVLPAVPESGNLAPLSVRERGDDAVEECCAASAAAVINIQEWKNKVAQRKKTPKDREARLRELEKLPAGELIPMIWGRIADDDVDDELLCEVLLLLGDFEPEEDQGS